jgi:hypothetical protein
MVAVIEATPITTSLPRSAEPPGSPGFLILKRLTRDEARRIAANTLSCRSY